jgi:hypothetical protein
VVGQNGHQPKERLPRVERISFLSTEWLMACDEKTYIKKLFQAIESKEHLRLERGRGITLFTSCREEVFSETPARPATYRIRDVS